MANISLMYYDPKLGFAFCNGFAQDAETMFKIAFNINPDTLDQKVVAEINKTGTLYYTRRTDIVNGIQYQSTLELLKSELNEIGKL